MSDGTPSGGGQPVVGRAAVGQAGAAGSDDNVDETASTAPTSGNGAAPSSGGPSVDSGSSSAASGRASVPPSTATQTINVPSAFGGNGTPGSSSSYLGESSSDSSFGSSSSSSFDSGYGSSYDDSSSAPSSGAGRYGVSEPGAPSYGIPPGTGSTIGTSYGSGAGPESSSVGTATGTATVGGSGGALGSVGRAVRSAKSTMQAAAARGPRRARLQLRRIDPWSVLKFSLAVSAVLLIVFVVATTAIYVALWSMGVFDDVNNTIKTFTSDSSGTGGFAISPQLVIGGAAVIGLINVVLFSALATIGSFIYNVCADLVGGIEITLAERD
ncbi:DUF3566 domain-containing protein [Fodinicola acaciae]|uniref:DUF3566 domain-containing protein n=1 Tax=Fodinicola acaciae TaxID=2681555 RepID=UPI0016525922|nr:DUF3566 domain-containing protein [Fodinicola acaciae]